MAQMHPMLEPYRPSPGDPFDAVKAAHLLNRAGFGPTAADVEKVRAMGPQRAVESLLDFPDAPAEESTPDSLPDLSAIAGLPASLRQVQNMLAGKSPEEQKELRMKVNAANQEVLQAMMNWWMTRMATGPYPLQEKLTLLWHGHFTSSAKDEHTVLLMWRQNELIRRMAAGNFHEFVRSISRDPAMLDYLNNNENRKAHPNENYARELMELFTLGIGNYTETDVKEGARAFTGWGHDGDNFVFRPAQHDAGIKTFLGQRGNFDGDNIIDIILSRPASHRYVGTKLYKWFVSEDVDDSLSAALGDALVASRFEIRPMLRLILNSTGFYSSSTIGVQVKSPVQLMVGTSRQLGIALPVQGLRNSLQQMGQIPLMPPNVKGWPGGRMWINTSTLFVRYNAAVMLAGGDVQGLRGGTSAEAVVDEWVDRLIHRPIDPSQRKVLIDSLAGRPDRPDAVRKMVQLIVSMPEYQLC